MQPVTSLLYRGLSAYRFTMEDILARDLSALELPLPIQDLLRGQGLVTISDILNCSGDELADVGISPVELADIVKTVEELGAPVPTS